MTSFLLGLDTRPMEAKSVDALPEEDGWQFEPKWDGFRCLVFKSGADVELHAKSGKSLSRYFPEMLGAIRSARGSFVLDGELTVPVGSSLSFSALQDRIHPAESRIRRLSAETPALLVLFDCLATDRDGSLLDTPWSRRRAVLETIAGGLGPEQRSRLSAATRDPAVARHWLGDTEGALDGVIAKRADGPYVQGQRAMLKLKRLRSADCVVGGFRYAEGSRDVGSLLLGLYNAEGALDHVGFTSAIAHADRAAMTARLEPFRGGVGFTGKAPGGPSRWSTECSTAWEPLRPELVVEVRYDQVTDRRFRHGTTFLRWRPDKAPGQCRAEQLAEDVNLIIPWS